MLEADLDTLSNHEENIKKCCPSMEGAVNEDLIDLTAEGGIVLNVHEVHGTYLPFDHLWSGFEFIKYCPWCGELIRKGEEAEAAKPLEKEEG